VTLTIESLNKKFEFNTGSDQEGNSTGKFSNLKDNHTDNYSSDCHGSLVVRDISQLVGTGIYVDYTDTRILIFKQQGDQHPIAVVSQFPAFACVVIIAYALAMLYSSVVS
jgi:hypothetical protein